MDLDCINCSSASLEGKMFNVHRRRAVAIKSDGRTVSDKVSASVPVCLLRVLDLSPIFLACR